MLKAKIVLRLYRERVGIPQYELLYFGSCSFVKYIQYLCSILFLSFGDANLRWLHFVTGLQNHEKLYRVALFGPLFHVSRKYVYLRIIMAVKTDLPEILALRKAVEKRFGHPIECRSDFSSLAVEIERVTHNHIAENTLRRLWGRITGYDTVFTRTLYVLCRYVGCEHWNAFVVSLHKQSSRESDVISDAPCYLFGRHYWYNDVS